MKARNTALVIINTITFLAMIFINYASNAGLFGNVTVADVSHKYDTLFTPADYAFIIWAILFLLCAAFIMYQWTLIKNDPQQYIHRTGLWFAVSNVANAAWVYCWINNAIGISVILILILLFSLIMLTIKLNLELYDEPVFIIFFVWWPIVFYLGWLIAATVACIAAYLVSINWNGLGVTPDTWTIIMIAVASLIYLFLIKKRNLREAANVGVWAFVAIAIRQWHLHNNVAIAALIAAVILFAAAMRHGFKNAYYSPFAKIKRGEWK